VKCNESYELVIVFDEFDRLAQEQRRLFADTIKDLSDNSTNATIMLVGVANDVAVLIDEHQSIERCMSQIYMPPMANYELREIIESGLRLLDMGIDQQAKEIIVSLSRGYPYYTHLLCYEAAMKAIKAKSDTIKSADLAGAIKEAINSAQASVREDYLKAADGPRKGTTYPLVLLACALADTDDLGYFKPNDVYPPGGS
jgi:Cdc6-like AAA superfamily ATPase